jgi:hypothetical protein
MRQHLLVTQSCKGQQTSEKARCYKMEQMAPWQPWELNAFADMVAVGKMGTRLLLPRPFALTGDINRRINPTLGFTAITHNNLLRWTYFWTYIWIFLHSFKYCSETQNTDTTIRHNMDEQYKVRGEKRQYFKVISKCTSEVLMSISNFKLILIITHCRHKCNS